MASKLARFERELTELNDLVDRAGRSRAAEDAEPPGAAAEPEEAGRR
jgi:hypothetical protein